MKWVNNTEGHKMVTCFQKILVLPHFLTLMENITGHFRNMFENKGVSIILLHHTIWGMYQPRSVRRLEGRGAEQTRRAGSKCCVQLGACVCSPLHFRRIYVDNCKRYSKSGLFLELGPESIVFYYNDLSWYSKFFRVPLSY